MARRLSVAQAKARFSGCVRAAEEGEPVVITRHGKPVAALIRASDLDVVEGMRGAGPEAGLVGLAGGWKGSEELVREIERAGRSGARPAPDLD